MNSEICAKTFIYPHNKKNNNNYVKRICDSPFFINYSYLNQTFHKVRQIFKVFPHAFQHTYPQFSLFRVTKYDEVLERICRLWHA